MIKPVHCGDCVKVVDKAMLYLAVFVSIDVHGVPVTLAVVEEIVVLEDLAVVLDVEIVVDDEGLVVAALVFVHSKHSTS